MKNGGLDDIPIAMRNLNDMTIVRIGRQSPCHRRIFGIMELDELDMLTWD
jgi:hypothetical protein